MQNDKGTSKIALLMPGQGSQAVGMGRDLRDNFPAARAVFEEADEALDFSLSNMCFEGDEAELQLTTNTQPAILTVSVAALRAMAEEGFPLPSYAAGHSLGEYSALVASGAMAFSDAVKVVRKRGAYMQEAVPPGVGAMAAILGLDIEAVEEGCREASGDQVCQPANINSPSQIVIAGNTEAVDRACEILKEKGAKRAIKLNVSAPFHCSLMLPAQERLAADLAELKINEFSFPVCHNVDAAINNKPTVVADRLTKQVSSPVRWVATIKELRAQGVDAFIEVGPGKVLCGLNRQIDREIKSFNVEDAESLRNSLESL